MDEHENAGGGENESMSERLLHLMHLGTLGLEVPGSVVEAREMTQHATQAPTNWGWRRLFGARGTLPNMRNVASAAGQHAVHEAGTATHAATTAEHVAEGANAATTAEHVAEGANAATTAEHVAEGANAATTAEHVAEGANAATTAEHLAEGASVARTAGQTASRWGGLARGLGALTGPLSIALGGLQIRNGLHDRDDIRGAREIAAGGVGIAGGAATLTSLIATGLGSAGVAGVAGTLAPILGMFGAGVAAGSMADDHWHLSDRLSGTGAYRAGREEHRGVVGGNANEGVNGEINRAAMADPRTRLYREVLTLADQRHVPLSFTRASDLDTMTSAEQVINAAAARMQAAPGH